MYRLNNSCVIPVSLKSLLKNKCTYSSVIHLISNMSCTFIMIKNVIAHISKHEQIVLLLYTHDFILQTMGIKYIS